MKELLKKMLIQLGYYSKPSFLIIGAQKAGTSGLFSTLNQHSQIAGSNQKEIHYFSDEHCYAKNKIADYHHHFSLPYKLKKGTLLFEASPNYIFHPQVAQRLHQYNPGLKFILLLRDPALRAFSAWKMHHYTFKNGKYTSLYDPRSFKSAIDDEMQKLDQETFFDNTIAYVKRGIYHDQIQEYLKYFPSKQMLILENTEILEMPPSVSRQIQAFLGLPYEEISPKIDNKSPTLKDPNYAEVIERLKAFYKPHNTLLFSLIGKKYNWD